MSIGSAHAEDIGSDELRSLVTGKKWMIAFTGDLSDAGYSNYWDFNPDGSMCVRLPGVKPNAPCADKGEWKLEAQTLCWDLTWVGAHYGYKSACVRVQKAAGEQYEDINVKGEYRVFAFRPVK